MSYAGMGEYFNTGLGSLGCGCGTGGCGCSGYGSAGPAYVLDVEAVMADIAESDKCYGPTPIKDYPQGKCNFASQRASKEIAAALNALGYGPIAVDGSLSWKSAYTRFLNDHGLSKGPGLGITRQALLAMERDLSAGKTPGPNKPVEYEKVNGEHVPKLTIDTTDEQAGMSGTEWLLAALAAGGAGYLVYRAAKKKKGGRKGGRPMTRAMVIR